MPYHADGLNSTQVCINGQWVTARPVNYRHDTLWSRMRDAWLVLTRKADAITFHEAPND